MAPQVEFAPDIPPAVWPYLVAQRGRLHDLAVDPAAWRKAYAADLMAQYDALIGWLPPTAERILDVGGGAGGINILLDRHFGGLQEIAILDSIAARPDVLAHDIPFSNSARSSDFLRANGVNAALSFVSPWLARQPIEVSRGPKYDLVISSAAWCFHFPPEDYLAFVRGRMAAGARIIIELRRGRPAWEAALNRAFRQVGQAPGNDKFKRWIGDKRTP